MSIIGPSPEVIRHHVKQHERTCTSTGCEERICACGQAVAIVCLDCGGCVFVIVRPWLPICAHAREVMAA